MFINEQHDLLLIESNNQPVVYSTEWLKKNLEKPSVQEFAPIPITQIRPGRFYFLMYDLDGKSQKVEKFNPCFTVAYRMYDKHSILHVVNTNFILPNYLRVAFFNDILQSYDQWMEQDLDVNEIVNQRAYEVKYEDVYKYAKSIGFEWSLRELIVSKIHKVFEIHTGNIVELLNINTTKLTGLDERAIEKIWKAKIREQAQRERDLLIRLGSGLSKEELARINELTPEQRREMLIKSGVEITSFLK
jgi:hypothetical protein